MPIEDADKLHSRRGDEATITIFKHKIGFIKLMAIIGISIAAIFMLIGGVIMMTPQPVPVIVPVTPQVVGDTTIGFEVNTTNYNYKIIKMWYGGNKPISNINTELMLSMYPPSSSHYVQRQAIKNENVVAFNSEFKTIYIYTGIDNAFHMSYDIPKYSECVDFIDGNWLLNVDENTRNLYKFKFNMSNSKTKLIDSGMVITTALSNSSDYSTFFIYQGTYKERLSITKPIRIIGVNNPVIDAGGLSSNIIITSSNNVISGLTLINSGVKDLSDGGIVIMSKSTGNIITKNTIYKTFSGILLYQSNNNTITNNTIHDNDKNGMLIVTSSSNFISGNTIYFNVNGIYADSYSNYNNIRENNVYNNRDYGILIENYAKLNNICEYNTYKNNLMACSDSVDRDQIPIVKTTTPTPTITIKLNDDWWSDCKGDPKCYQSA